MNKEIIFQEDTEEKKSIAFYTQILANRPVQHAQKENDTTQQQHGTLPACAILEQILIVHFLTRYQPKT